MITQLRIHQLRNLHALTVNPTQHNWIIGKNGSGKTSLLEAVFLLSRGKTFRHHQPRHYITHGQNACTIWADTHAGEIALQKTLDENAFGGTTFKVDGQAVTSQSALSYALPVLLLDPSGMAVLEEGGTSRRQLLDWLVFHVKPQFYGLWLSHQKLLKHRNHLLKMPNIAHRQAELVAWDNQLAQYAHGLHECRLHVVELWQPLFEQMIGKLLPRYQGQLSLSYQAGFDEELGLADILRQRVQADIEAGYTRMGAHRADLLVWLLGKSRTLAVNVLSRGEKKLLLSALKLSQLQLLCQYHKGQNLPVVLIDDLDSELDQRACQILLDVLFDLPCQLFISSLDKHKLGDVLSKSPDICVIQMG